MDSSSKVVPLKTKRNLTEEQVKERLVKERARWQRNYNGRRQQTKTDQYLGRLQVTNCIAGIVRLTAFSVMWTCVALVVLSLLVFLSIESTSHFSALGDEIKDLQSFTLITISFIFFMLMIIGGVLGKGRFSRVKHNEAVSFADSVQDQENRTVALRQAIDQRLHELQVINH